MESRKYKLVRIGRFPFMNDLVWGKDAVPVYRIKALRDIPKHGVKKGDLGGYVTGKFNLSQEGNCWIEKNAQALGNVIVSNDACLSGYASVMSDSERWSIEVTGAARIRENAKVSFDENFASGNANRHMVITGNAVIGGKAKVLNTGLIEGDVDIYDNASILGAHIISGKTNIFGSATVEIDATVAGETRIGDNAIIEYKATVYDSRLYEGAQVYAETMVKNQVLGVQNHKLPAPVKKFKKERNPFIKELEEYEGNLEKRLAEERKLAAERVAAGKKLTVGSRVALAKDGSFASVSEVGSKDAERQAAVADALLLLKEVNAKNEAYETDIVKIIKYPVMVDKGYATTAEFHMALGRANRMALNPAHAGFVGAVNAAEKAFLAAESYALKMAATALTDIEKKKLSKANDLLTLASDEAATDHEKKVAFVQAFKQLEGVLAVPEVAVDTFRIKIGLKELKA